MRPLHELLVPAQTRDEGTLATLAARARSIARRVLGQSRAGMLPAEDAADVVSTVMLRLLRHLRDDEAEPIGSFDHFVSTLTHHALYDYLRRRYPERTRLKNRLRYVLTHDKRFTLRNTADGVIAGLAAWRDAAPAPAATLQRETATAGMLDASKPAAALAEIFVAIGRPLPLEELVRLTAELWQVREAETADAALLPSVAPDPTQEIEQRQYLELVWREIVALRPAQRRALLLNMRDSDGLNALALFVLVGTATFDQIAEAVELTPEGLAKVWEQLPMPDLAIAEILGVTRQQVINLRKSAHERLARRMDRERGKG